MLISIGGAPLVLVWAFAYLDDKCFISMVKLQHFLQCICSNGC